MEVLSAAEVWRWRKIELRLERSFLVGPTKAIAARWPGLVSIQRYSLSRSGSERQCQLETLNDNAAQLRESPWFRPGFSEIADLRHVEKLSSEGRSIDPAARQGRPLPFESERAFVVGNSLQAHAACMHKILRAQRSFEIFHSLAEAKQSDFVPRACRSTKARCEAFPATALVIAGILAWAARRPSADTFGLLRGRQRYCRWSAALADIRSPLVHAAP